MESLADRVVAGRQGAALCLQVATARSRDLRRLVDVLAEDIEERNGGGYPRIESIRLDDAELDQLAHEIARIDLTAIADRSDPLPLLDELGESLPQDEDNPEDFIRLAIAMLPAVRDLLRPVAQAVLASPASAWWRSSLGDEPQYLLTSPTSARPAGIRHASAAENRDALHERLRRIEDDRSSHGGDAKGESHGAYASTLRIAWDSPAPPVRLPSTTRRLGPVDAVELAFRYQHDDPATLRLQLLTPRTARPRVYEIHGPEDWAALVTRYPHEDTHSGRSFCWDDAVLDSRWFIPDYLAVAADYDAIHVSVIGYLTTAGDAHPVPGGHTVFTGWDPDETYWLGDVDLGDPQPDSAAAHYTGVSTATVASWDDDEGWGVLEADALPGGCWCHYSAVQVDGFRTLPVGATVELHWETADQDGYRYRATSVFLTDAPPRPEEPPVPSTSTFTIDITVEVPDNTEITELDRYLAVELRRLWTAHVVGRVKEITITGPGIESSTEFDVPMRPRSTPPN